MNGSDTPQPDIVAQLAAIEKLAADTAAFIERQSALLAIRNLAPPGNPLGVLNVLHSELTSLAQRAEEEEIEIGDRYVLVENSARMNSTLHVDEVLAEAMDKVLALTGAERGCILLCREDTGEPEFRMVRDPAQTSVPHQPYEISNSILNEVLQSGNPLLTDDARIDPRIKSVTVAKGLRSVLCVPLLHKNTVTGAVYVDNRVHAGLFGKRAQDLLTDFAHQIAIALENAQLYERVQISYQEITRTRSLMDNVFASIGSGVLTMDATQHILTCNDAAGRVLGLVPSYVNGRHLREILPALSDSLRISLRKVLQDNREFTRDVIVHIPSRGETALNVRLSPLKDATGGIQGVALVFDDLTEQRAHAETITVLSRYLPPAMVEKIDEIAGLALGGERREITCMFVDARPFTLFTHETTPPQRMEILNRFFASAAERIHEAGGVVDKYMGSEVMALFNTQLNPHDNHAMRAAQAAVAIREDFARLCGQLGVSADAHAYRIGIHTGVATLGNVGSLSRRDFTAIGDTVNLAKRLQENAPSGQIIASDETRRHAQSSADTLSFVSRGLITVKGRAQETHIYEVHA